MLYMFTLLCNHYHHASQTGPLDPLDSSCIPSPGSHHPEVLGGTHGAISTVGDPWQGSLMFTLRAILHKGLWTGAKAKCEQNNYVNMRLRQFAWPTSLLQSRNWEFFSWSPATSLILMSTVEVSKLESHLSWGGGGLGGTGHRETEEGRSSSIRCWHRASPCKSSQALWCKIRTIFLKPARFSCSTAPAGHVIFLPCDFFISYRSWCGLFQGKPGWLGTLSPVPSLLPGGGRTSCSWAALCVSWATSLPPCCIWHHVLIDLGSSGISGSPRMHTPSLALGHVEFCVYVMACSPGISCTTWLFLKRDFSERCVLFLSYIWDSEACFLLCSHPIYLLVPFGYHTTGICLGSGSLLRDYINQGSAEK